MQIAIDLISEALFLLRGKSRVHLCLGDLITRTQNVDQLERVWHLHQVEVKSVSFNMGQNIALVIDCKSLIFHVALLNPTSVVIAKQFKD